MDGEERQALENAAARAALLDVIRLSGELNYKKDGLEFNDAVVNAVIKAFDLVGWQEQMMYLKKKEVEE